MLGGLPTFSKVSIFRAMCLSFEVFFFQAACRTLEVSFLLAMCQPFEVCFYRAMCQPFEVCGPPCRGGGDEVGLLLLRAGSPVNMSFGCG